MFTSNLVIYNDLNLNDLEVYFQPAKTKSKQTIVFIHGFGVYFDYFACYANDLTTYDYYALSLPGYNHLPYQNHQLSMVYYAQLVAKWINEKDFENLILIGHSMGGGIVGLTKQFLTNKKAIDKFVLLTPINKMIIWNYFKIKKSFQKPVFERLAYFKEIFKNKFPEFENDDERWLIELQKHETVCQLNSKTLFKELPFVEKAYQQLNKPTYVLLGQNDLFMSPTRTKKHFIKILHNVSSQIAMLYQAEHQLFASQPLAFRQAMDDVLANKTLAPIY